MNKEAKARMVVVSARADPRADRFADHWRIRCNMLSDRDLRLTAEFYRRSTK